MRTHLVRLLGTQADAWIATFRKTRQDLSPTDLFMAITTAQRMRAGAVNMAEKKAQQGTAPVYSYILTYQNQSVITSTNHIIGASHASDIRMKFDNPDIVDPPKGQERFEIFGGDKTEAHRQTAHNMSRMWATFARTGHPGAEGQPEWPAYTMAKRATMMINAQCQVVDDPEHDERVFWQNLMPT
jgi:para-nitrobenzyl esterase